MDERRRHDFREEEGDWKEWRIHVLRTLEGHDEEIKDLRDGFTAVKIKVAVVSVIGGAAASLALEFIFHLVVPK